jgi:hypothetical protein
MGAFPGASAQASASFELGGQALTFLYPDKMHEAGMTWLKMQITYRRSGPNGDAQNVITHARNHGFKVLLSVVGIKSELAANPSQYYSDYAQFLGTVAALNPDAIEVWNEPNIDQEWPAGLISGAAYTQMLAQAYTRIKQVNPNVMVISGAPAPTGYFGGGCAHNGCDDLIFIQQMKAAGAEAYFDCTGIHYNEGILPPTATSGDPRGNSDHYTRYYPTMVSTYRGVFPNKPLCFTELGYLTPSGLGSLPPGFQWAANTTAHQQADWLAQAAALSRDGGVVRLMIVWNVNAPFYPSNPFAGWAMIRQNNVCLPCETLGLVMSGAHPPSAAPQRNMYTVNSITLGWGGVSWADAYEVQIADRASFASPRILEVVVPAHALEITTPPLANGLYYWRVRARQPNGSWGRWSEADSFRVAVPG